MQKQNSSINGNWLALMHGLTINPRVKPAGEKMFSQESIDLGSATLNDPKISGGWQRGSNGKLKLSFKR